MPLVNEFEVFLCAGALSVLSLPIEYYFEFFDITNRSMWQVCWLMDYRVFSQDTSILYCLNSLHWHPATRINKTPTRFAGAADELNAVEAADFAGAQWGEALLYLAAAGARLGGCLVPLVVRLTIFVPLDVVEDTVLRNKQSLTLERTHCIVGSNTLALTLCMCTNSCCHTISRFRAECKRDYAVL